MKIYCFILFLIFAFSLGCGTTAKKTNISSKKPKPIEQSPAKEPTNGPDESDPFGDPDESDPFGDPDESDPFGDPDESDPNDLLGEEETPRKSGLQVGYADDNQQFNYFTHFLERKFSQVSASTVQKIKIEERIKLIATDANEKPIANAKVKIYSSNHKLVSEGKTHADGSFLFFPGEESVVGISSFVAKISYSGKSTKKEFQLDDYIVKAKFDFDRENLQGIHVDTVFILDVSSSMEDELEQIKTAIQNSCSQLVNSSAAAKFRFGMVLYRDSKNPQLFPLTDELEDFVAKLKGIKAEGGLDRPENLQLALKQALEKIEWNFNGLRNAFVITDAPPQTLTYDTYTYAQAAKAAKKEGIKIFSIGTSGLDLTGEYVLRQISQYTSGKYIFLTYAKESNQKVKPKKVSFHVEHSYDEMELEELIKQLIIQQLEILIEPEKETEEEYFSTTERKDPFENKIDISEMAIRFKPAIGRLFERLQKQSKGPLKIFLHPIKTEEKGLSSVAKKLDESLKIAFVNSKSFFQVYEPKEDISSNQPQAEGKLFASIKDLTLRLNLWDIKGKLKEYLSATTIKIFKNKKYSIVIKSNKEKGQKTLLAGVQQTLSKQFSVYYHHKLEEKLKQRAMATGALEALNVQDHMALKFYGKDLTAHIETEITEESSEVVAKVRCRIEDNIFGTQYFDTQKIGKGSNKKEALEQASVLVKNSLQTWIETKFSDINSSICILGYLQEQEKQTKLHQTLLALQEDGFITLDKTSGGGAAKFEYHIAIVKEQTDIEKLSQVIEERVEIEGVSLKISTFSRLIHITEAQEEEDA